MNAPVQIAKPRVAEGLRRVAKAEGKTITQLVEEMLAEREARRQAEIERRMAAARATVERFQALPIVGPLLTDDDFYDEDGFPR